MTKAPPSVLLLAAALSLPSGFAQTAPLATPEVPDEIVQLSVFEVKSSKDSGYRVENAVATTGLAQSLFQTPLAISVITNEFLREAGLEGFSGALKYASGVSFDAAAPNGTVTGGMNRNATAPALTRFRGQPFSGNFRNGLSYSTVFDTENADRIEVAKGPMAVFVGGAAAGGEVNLITRKPQFYKFNEVTVRIGSHASYQAGLDSTGPINDQLAYRVIGQYDYGNTWRDFSHRRKEFANLQLLWRPTNNISARLDYQYSNAHGNLVPPSERSTLNYQRDYDAPNQSLLDLGRLRTTGAGAGQPFTVNEYRTRIGQSFTVWRQDVFDTTSQWVSLGMGEGFSDGNWGSGRRANQLGSDAPFGYKAALFEQETTAKITDWLDVRWIARLQETDFRQDYFAFPTRLYPAGNTRLPGVGNSYKFAEKDRIGQINVVLHKAFGWFNPTLLLGGEIRRNERQDVAGLWDLTAITPAAGSPNVFGTPANLTGSNVFLYFDPRVHAYPNIRPAQRWANEVSPAGTASVDSFKSMPSAAFAAASLGFFQDRILLTGGFRQSDDYLLTRRLDRNGQQIGNKAEQQGVLNSWTYGVVAKVVKGINAFASYNQGETFQAGGQVDSGSPPIPADRVVSADEIAANPNPNLLGKGYDVGFKLELFERKLTGSISFFQLKRGNVMILDQARMAADTRNRGTEIDPNPATATPGLRPYVLWRRPVDGNISEGVETDILWTPNAAYTLVVGATKLWKNSLTVTPPASSSDAAGNRDFAILNGRPLENSPDTIFRLYQRYEMKSGTLAGASVGLGVRYRSSTMPDSYGTSWGSVLPSYVVADLNLGYRTKLFGRETDLLLSITNVTDKDYSDGLAFGAPREFSFVTRMRF